MFRYRPNKNSLTESMSEVRDFYSIDDMKKYLVDEFKGSINPDDIEISKEVVYNSHISDWRSTCFVRMKQYNSNGNARLLWIGYVDLGFDIVTELFENPNIGNMYCVDIKEGVYISDPIITEDKLW